MKSMRLGSRGRLGTAALCCAAWVIGCGDATNSSGSGSGGSGSVFGTPSEGGATTSGGASTGGVSSSTGGSASSTNRCAATPVGSEARIDNFEDGDMLPISEPQRNGHWGAGNNSAQPLPTLAVETPGANGTDFAAHLSSPSFTSNGLSLGLGMLSNGVACPYNAGNSVGISLYTRGQGRIRFSVSTQAIVTTEWGGSCDERTAMCWDAHQKLIPLDAEWTYREVRWDALSQAGWGTAVSFDPATIINFLFVPVSTDEPVELWVDELKFIMAESP